MVYRWVVVLGLGACGRVAFDPLSGDTGSLVDAGPCTEPFGAPIQLSSGMNVKDPSVADDELEMYTDDLAGTLHVWSRPMVGSPWSAPVPAVLPATNDPYNEYGASLVGDGLTLYFTSGRMGGAPVMRSKRASRTSPWGAEEDSGGRGGSDVRRDDLEIFFQDFVSPVRHMTRGSTAEPFVGDTPVSAVVNDGSDNKSPSISGDGLDLYFDSDRGGSRALYVAHRASTTADFATVEALGMAGQMPEISADGRHLYFVVDGGTNYDLWLASRCE